LEPFGLDLVQTISDPYREADDLGLKVEYPPDSLCLSKEPLLVEPSDFGKLRRIAPEQGKRMNDRLKAVYYLHHQLTGSVPVMGWVEGPMALAADLRGVTNVLTDLYDRPEWLTGLLDFCLEIALSFARRQIELGADIVGLGDSICSQISPVMYRRFGLPYEQRVFAAIHEMGALGRLHICGNISSLLPDIRTCGADIVDVDWMVDFGEAERMLHGGPAVNGNFDPVAIMLQGSPADVKRAVVACLDAGGPRCFSGGGCEIPDGTPVANLMAQKEALREYGKR
jgi:MtaA/CmuA family methyltransferase